MTKALGFAFDLSSVEVAVEGRQNEEKENFVPQFKHPHERFKIDSRLDKKDPYPLSLSDHSPLSTVFNNNFPRTPTSSFKSLKRSSDLFDRGHLFADLSRSAPPGIPLSAKKAKVIVLSKGDQDEVMKSEEPSSETSNPPSPDENRPPFRSPTDARSGPLPPWSLPDPEDALKPIPRSASVPLSVILNPPHSSLSRSTIDFPFATERPTPPGLPGTHIITKVVPQIKRATPDDSRKGPSFPPPPPSPSPSSSSPSLSPSQLKKNLQSMECLDDTAPAPSPPEALSSSSQSAFSANPPKTRPPQEALPPTTHTTPTRMAPQLPPGPGAHQPHLATKVQPDIITYTENIRSQRENLLVYENALAGLRVQGQRPSHPAVLSRALPCATQIRGLDCKPSYMNGLSLPAVDRTEKLTTSYCSGNLRIRMVAGGVNKQPTSQKKAFVYQFQ